jgi:glucose/arabinose dehydrogenase
VQLPKSLQWKGLEKYIVMGTLAEQSLIFIELTSNKEVGEVFKYNVGQRIRDLEVLSDGRLVATTDSGALLFISR